MDEELLDYLFDLKVPIYTMEDNVLYGGFGSSILEHYSSKGKYANIKIFAHKNGILEHGDKQNLLEFSKLDSSIIAEQIYMDILRGKYEKQ